MKNLIISIGLIISFTVPFDKRCTFEDMKDKQCKRASINKSEYCKKHYHKY